MQRLLVCLVLVLLTVSPAGAQLAADQFVPTGLDFPVGFVQDPINPAVQFVVEQTGRIRIIQSGALLSSPFLDLSASIGCCGERGLLGLAFPPDAATSGRFYVSFTNPDGNNVVARFTRTADPLVGDPSSRFDLRWGSPTGPPYIFQPFGNHNGGNIAFGPDGYLYIARGDGGTGGPAQNPESLLGKILRIDVNVPVTNPQGYVVPASNPFVGASPTLPEIWAFGLRNPWKFTFDDGPGGTGALLIADVGQDSWEEVNYEPANRGGRNYGWMLREGAHATGAGPPTPGAPATLTDPFVEYSHATGFSITGGYVYRGSELGGFFNGRYFFADFVTGRVWSVAVTTDPVTAEGSASDLREHTGELSGGGSSVGTISSFGRDAQGELYLVLWSGRILKIISTTPRLTAVAITPNRSSPQVPETTITWTATPSGGTAPQQYKWWVWDGVSWTMAADWSTDNTFAWTPSANGDYIVGVWARSDGNSADTPEVRDLVSFTISGSATVTSVTLAPNRTAPQAAGTTITWMATPTGGSGPHQYKWWVYDGTSWANAVNWTTASTFAWTPSAGGDYIVGVWVRSAGNSTDAAEALALVSFAISGTPPATTVGSVTLTPNRSAPQAAGTTITWTATPSGGTAPQQYKWWVYDGASWTAAVDWTTTNTFAWTPSSAGNYIVGVWVRSGGNSADAAEARLLVDFAISGTPPATPVAAVALTANRSAPQAAGTPITWTATPSGGVAPQQYKWWVYDGTSWTAEVDWTTTNTFAWTPALANANYIVGVWVRSAATSADAAEARQLVNFAITGSGAPAPVSAVTLSADRTSPQAPGTTITWTATPSGGTAPQQYKWWVYDGVSWTAAVDWTTANTFAWTPTTGGNYSVGVWVRSAGNSANAAEASHVVPFTISGSPPAARANSVTMAADRSAPQAPSTTISWMATPSGGTTPYQYKWWVYDGVSWTMAVDWTTANTFAWTPSATGDYIVGVWVRSAGNSADAAEVSHLVPFAIR